MLTDYTDTELRDAWIDANRRIREAGATRSTCLIQIWIKRADELLAEKAKRLQATQ